MVKGARHQAGTDTMFYQFSRHQEIDMTQAKSNKNSTPKGQRPTATAPRPVKVPMTPARAQVIQSHAAMKKTGTVKANDFAARTQSGADHNVNKGIVPRIDRI